MTSAALGIRIEESNDPSELVPDHLLPVQFTELLQRPSERTPEHKLMAAVLEEAIRTFVAAPAAEVHVADACSEKRASGSPRTM